MKRNVMRFTDQMAPDQTQFHQDSEQLEGQYEEFRDTFNRIQREVSKQIVGQQEIIEGALICLMTGGHALLEGVPGLGKTLLIRTLHEVLDLGFSRIQFTPDLMPADIIGTNVVAEDESGRKFFEFQQGPVFANLVLADEINRATPKTQSALLEAMQEKSVTVAGTHHELKLPFFVMATQNPLEMEGTYPLPEAQLDRFFFKLKVEYPSLDELDLVMERTTKREIPFVEKVCDGEQITDWNRLCVTFSSQKMCADMPSASCWVHIPNRRTRRSSRKNMSATVQVPAVPKR